MKSKRFLTAFWLYLRLQGMGLHHSFKLQRKQQFLLPREIMERFKRSGEGIKYRTLYLPAIIQYIIAYI